MQLEKIVACHSEGRDDTVAGMSGIRRSLLNVSTRDSRVHAGSENNIEQGQDQSQSWGGTANEGSNWGANDGVNEGVNNGGGEIPGAMEVEGGGDNWFRGGD